MERDEAGKRSRLTENRASLCDLSLATHGGRLTKLISDCALGGVFKCGGVMLGLRGASSLTGQVRPTQADTDPSRYKWLMHVRRNPAPPRVQARNRSTKTFEDNRRYTRVSPKSWFVSTVSNLSISEFVAVAHHFPQI